MKNELTKTLSHKISITERILHLEEKEAVKAMSKRGYISIYFGFCGVVVHFLGNGRQWWIYIGWWWVVVDVFWLVVGGVGGGGHILASGGWW